MAFTEHQLAIISDLLWEKAEHLRFRARVEQRELADWEKALEASYEGAAEEADRQRDALGGAQ